MIIVKDFEVVLVPKTRDFPFNLPHYEGFKWKHFSRVAFHKCSLVACKDSPQWLLLPQNFGMVPGIYELYCVSVSAV